MQKVIIFLTLLISVNIFADSTKQLWLEHQGINDCDEGKCADGIPTLPLKMAFEYYKTHQDIIDNHDYIAVADFRMPSTKKRLFILNLKTGVVESMLVTHGKKTEGKLAMAENFSNVVGSEMSSFGFYLTAIDSYVGKHGNSLRLTGLSNSNSNALERAIVFHGADYATQWFVDEKGRLGLSQGCPAVAPNKIDGLIKKLKGHALFLIFSDQMTEN